MSTLGKKTVEDLNVKGRNVLVRCDFNVPMKDGVITNDNRIVAALPTIKKLIENGGRLVLCSHLGKPKNGPEEKFSLAPVAVRLSELLGKPVVFANDGEVTGPNAKAAVAAMQDGDVVLLQNTRFRKEETKNLPEFSKDLAELVGPNAAYVNDAFGSAHRAHCSTAGVTDYIKDTAVGYLMEKEIRYLGNAVNNPERPFVAILGGAKVADKLNVIENLLSKVDTLIIGGGMAYTFLKAKGCEVGTSLVDDEKLDYCANMLKKAEEKGVKLLPVDSEHSAIFQCLQGAAGNPLHKILLTASGGPFRGFTREQLEKVRLEDALKHPNWSMGHKITIDSSTMVNKGLEVMEARWLFGAEMDQVQVVVQPASIIHSMVEFEDGAVIAQLGTPDMKLPIQYALYYPERRFLPGDRLDFEKLTKISFEVPDMETFRGLKLAYEAGRRGGTLPTVFNAANEMAVAMFLERKINYLAIVDMIEGAMEHHCVKPSPDVAQILEAEQETYDYLSSKWN